MKRRKVYFVVFFLFFTQLLKNMRKREKSLESLIRHCFEPHAGRRLPIPDLVDRFLQMNNHRSACPNVRCWPYWIFHLFFLHHVYTQLPQTETWLIST